MTIETICNLLLAALAEAGLKESTLFNYKGAVRRFKAFCSERDVVDYTPEIGKAYADDVISIAAKDITCRGDYQGCSPLTTIPANLIFPS